ncbi:MAG: cysteine desulfurase [Bdellovibrionales bacterium]|nr:cysteine desulfurase [Bdellovibrionales bacterium]
MKDQASERLYFDNNATTPPHPDVVARVGEWLSAWGNPSSVHGHGRGPKVLLRDARQHLSHFLNASPLELIFTAGGSEGNSLVFQGVFEHQKKLGRTHYLVSQVEHPSVTKAAKALEAKGATVHWIPVSRGGKLDLAFVEAKLGPQTAMISCMLANNETGSIFPLHRLAKLAHEVGALIHSDCVQGMGKTPIDLKHLNLDYATFAGHKFYALKGAGVLFHKTGAPLDPVIFGGGHERGRRGGTENVLAIASLGAMALKKDVMDQENARVGGLRDHLEAWVLENISGTKVNGSEERRLPNTSSITIDGIDGEVLLMNLDIQGASVSTGSACSSGSQDPSQVLLAMGLSRAEASSTLRVSLSWFTQMEDVQRFCLLLQQTISKMRDPKPSEFQSHVKR